MPHLLAKLTGCSLILLSLTLLAVHGTRSSASSPTPRSMPPLKGAAVSFTDDPSRIESFRKAYDAEQQKNYSEAAKILQQLPKESQDYLSNMRTGWLLFAAKDYRTAQKHFEAAARQGQDAFEPKSALVLALINQQRYADAEKSAKLIILQDQDNYYANLRTAYVSRLQQKLQQAQRVNQRMLTLHPADPSFLIEQAMTLSAQRRYEEARPYYQKVLLVNPDNTIANQALSLAQGTRARDFVSEAFRQAYQLELERRYAEAIEALTALKSYKPYEYFAHLRLGWLYYLAGKHAESRQSYEQAVKLAPRAVEPLEGLLLPLLAQESYAEAVKVARQAVQLDPMNYYARLRLGYALRKQEVFAEAEQSNDLMLRRYPTDVQFLLEQALTLNGLKRTDEAGRLFRQVQLLAPENATAKAVLSQGQKKE